jgi:hypothetical protein
MYWLATCVAEVVFREGNCIIPLARCGHISRIICRVVVFFCGIRIFLFIFLNSIYIPLEKRHDAISLVYLLYMRTVGKEAGTRSRLGVCFTRDVMPAHCSTGVHIIAVATEMVRARWLALYKPPGKSHVSSYLP